MGILETGKNLFNYQDDYKSLRQVLLHLSDVIKWAARYPLPNNTATVFKLSENVNTILIYGFHILDVMQPLFDLFEHEMKEYEDA